MKQYLTEQLLYHILIPLGDKNKAQPFHHAILCSIELTEFGAVTLCFAIKGTSGHAVLDVIIYLCLRLLVFV